MAKHKHIHLNKSLGQHFLKDDYVLTQIYQSILENTQGLPLLEVGPGAGALSAYLKDQKKYKLVEFDSRWVKHLKQEFSALQDEIIQADFLQASLVEFFDEPFAVVGNFPYNISSQIVFKIIDNRETLPIMLGMFQKEMARRICAKEGSKDFGIISVLTQLFYETTYLFDVPREAFNPPPKVMSGVMVMKRRKTDFAVNPVFFKNVVKLAFNQRRKTLRNSLKQFIKNDEVKALEVFNLRPEQVSLDGLINLANILELYN